MTGRFFLITLIGLLLVACNPDSSGKGKNTTEQSDAADSGVQVDSLLKEINKRIADDPGNYKNYLERAKYYGDRLSYALAYEDIARAMEVDSTQSDIYLIKGRLLFQQEKIKEAYNEYKNCLEKDPNNVDCMMRKAEIDIVLGNYNQARDLINAVLQQNEFNAEAYYLRGRMYKALRDTTLAASSYKTAIEVDPNYYDAYIEVALLYANQKSDLAKEYYNSAIEIKPKSVEAWYNKAMYLQETGYRKPAQYREAMSCYDTIIKIDNRFSAAYFNKGYIYLEYMQKYDSAAFQFTNALGVLPSYYQAYYNRGLAYESLDRKKDAESDYRSALAIEPTYTEAAIGLERVLRGK